MSLVVFSRIPVWVKAFGQISADCAGAFCLLRPKGGEGEDDFLHGGYLSATECIYLIREILHTAPAFRHRVPM